MAAIKATKRAMSHQSPKAKGAVRMIEVCIYIENHRDTPLFLSLLNSLISSPHHK